MTWLFVAAFVGAVVLLAMAGLADVDERHHRKGGGARRAA